MNDELQAMPELLAQVRPASDELRAIASDPRPPPPHDVSAARPGGGHPNDRDAAVSCPLISSPQNSADFVSPMAEMVEVYGLPPTEDVDRGELVLCWSGAPTKRALEMLRDEVRTPNWDAEQAVMLLDLVGNGTTLTRACEMVGLRRSVVLAWRRLVPEFDGWMSDAEMALGAYWRDRATDEADPAYQRSLLAVAGAYDRRIAKGEGDSGGVTGVVVTVNRFE